MKEEMMEGVLRDKGETKCCGHQPDKNMEHEGYVSLTSTRK